MTGRACELLALRAHHRNQSFHFECRLLQANTDNESKYLLEVVDDRGPTAGKPVTLPFPEQRARALQQQMRVTKIGLPCDEVGVLDGTHYELRVARIFETVSVHWCSASAEHFEQLELLRAVMEWTARSALAHERGEQPLSS